ncbi:MAG: hypothetical protein KC464_22515, partial [Myxococcales bacterium]|nr:hypothetical protein [Myxococcales bacterium]
ALPLVPLDPARVTTAPELQVSAAGDALGSWLVVGGIRPRDAEVTATVRTTGGVAILLGLTDAGHLDAVELRPTAPTRLVRHDGGDPEVLCTGASVAADALTGSHTIAVTARDGAITVTLGDLELLTCEPVTLREGLVGVAPLGDGATLTLLTMSVTR